MQSSTFPTPPFHLSHHRPPLIFYIILPLSLSCCFLPCAWLYKTACHVWSAEPITISFGSRAHSCDLENFCPNISFISPLMMKWLISWSCSDRGRQGGGKDTLSISGTALDSHFSHSLSPLKAHEKSFSWKTVHQSLKCRIVALPWHIFSSFFSSLRSLTVVILFAWLS